MLTRNGSADYTSVMGMIYMIRHGQASFGRRNYDRISPLGIRQSRILGEYLVRTGLQFDAVYSWKLERQQATAREVIACYREGGLDIPDVIFSEALNEFDSKAVIMAQVPDMVREKPGVAKDVENIYTDRKSFQRVFEEAVLRWISGTYQKTGLEPWQDFSSRVCEGIRMIIAEQGRRKKIALFTSGGAISALLQNSLSLPAEQAIRLSWQIINTSVTRFMYDEERITLAGFNMISHLELHKDPSLITYR